MSGKKKPENQTDTGENATPQIQLSPAECDELKAAGIDDPQAFIGNLLANKAMIAKFLRIIAGLLESGHLSPDDL